MIEIVRPIVGFAVNVFTALWAHMIAHYLVGSIWTDDHSIERWKILPVTVDFSDADLPPKAYTYIGLAPLILIVPLAIMLVFEVIPYARAGTWSMVLAHVPSMIAPIPTLSDLQPLRSDSGSFETIGI